MLARTGGARTAQARRLGEQREDDSREGKRVGARRRGSRARAAKQLPRDGWAGAKGARVVRCGSSRPKCGEEQDTASFTARRDGLKSGQVGWDVAGACYEFDGVLDVLGWGNEV